jgi:hypothetical protein
MTIKAEFVKHLLHGRRYLRCLLVTQVAGPAPGAIDKIVMTVGTGSLSVIRMLEQHGQHRLRGCCMGTILFGNHQQEQGSGYT